MKKAAAGWASPPCNLKSQAGTPVPPKTMKAFLRFVFDGADFQTLGQVVQGSIHMFQDGLLVLTRQSGTHLLQDALRQTESLVRYILLFMSAPVTREFDIQ